MKSLSTVLLLSAMLTFIPGCKKNKTVPSGRKFINSFVFKESFNHGLGRDVEGVIVKDTIKVSIPVAVDIKALIPDVVHEGVSVSPAARIPQDFSNPLRYTVTAADGSTQTYIVVVRYSGTTKDITSFILRKSDNNALLSADITGIITGDVIELPVPVGTSLQMLTPSVTHTGKSVSPNSQVGQDFSKPVYYIVEAEDGTYQRYTVIAGSNATVYIGSNDGFLYALNAITGKLRWKYGTSGEVYSSPTLKDGFLYVGSLDGYLYAINAQTGKMKWRAGIGGVPSAPVVSNGVVIATSSPDIFALEASTGNIMWRVRNNYGVYNPVLSGGTTYVPTFSPGLICYDAISGVQKWWVNTGIIRGNPALADNTLYLGTEFRRLIAVDALTGVQKWQSQDVDYRSSTHDPTVYKDAVFIGAADKLYSYNRTTGMLNWSFTADQHTFPSPVASNDIIYSASARGSVFAIDATTGTQKWRTVTFENISQIASAYDIPRVTVANGSVVVGGYDNYIYCLDASNGGVHWRFRTNAGVFSGACIVDNNGGIYHAGNSGAQQ